LLVLAVTSKEAYWRWKINFLWCDINFNDKYFEDFAANKFDKILPVTQPCQVIKINQRFIDLLSRNLPNVAGHLRICWVLNRTTKHSCARNLCERVSYVQRTLYFELLF